MTYLKKMVTKAGKKEKLVRFSHLDTEIKMVKVFKNKKNAQEMLREIEREVHLVEQEPCQMAYHLLETEKSCILKVNIHFHSEAEAALFQLAFP